MQSDSQESIQFGEVDPTIDQPVPNDSSDDSPILIEQETSSINPREQVTPIVANYGPCIMCNINERCIVFIECNHLACCGQCSTACNDICPVEGCNQPIREYLRVFKP